MSELVRPEDRLSATALMDVHVYHELYHIMARIEGIEAELESRETVAQAAITIPVVGTVPTYAKPGDAGGDLYADADYWVCHGSATLIHFDTAVAIPEGHVGLLLPRSGGGSRGLALTNTIGVIDSGFRGKIRASMTLNLPGQAYGVAKGQRVAQLVIVPFAFANFIPVKELPPSERGDGGFGSTGV